MGIDTSTYAAKTAEMAAHEAMYKCATTISVVGLRVVVDTAYRNEVKATWALQMEEIAQAKAMEKLKSVKGSTVSHSGCSC